MKLAELFVDISGRDANLAGKLASIKAGLSSAGSSLTGLFKGIAAPIAAVAAAAGGAGLLYKSVQNAAELNSLLSKTEQIFGDASGAISRASEDMSNLFGVSRTEFQNAAVNFGAVFKSAGKSQEEAAKLGTSLAKLGMDMAAFDDVSNEEAFTAISSALRGEFDPIEKFRVFLRADAIEAEALRMGLAKTKAEITDSAKKQATLNLILQQTADAHGTLAREADQTGSKQKAVWGQVANAMTDLGQQLLPLWDTILGAAASTLGSISDWLRDNQATVQGWVAWIQDGLNTLGVMWRNWGDVVAIAGITAYQYIINIGELFQWLIGAGGTLVGWFATNFVNIIRDALVSVWTIFDNIFTNIENLVGAAWAYIMNPSGGFNFNFTPLLEGFQAATEALPEIAKPALTSLQSEIDEITNRMADREIQRAENKAKTAAELAAQRAEASRLGIEAAGGAGGEAAAGGAAGGAGGKGGKFRSSGIVELASQIQAGALGKDQTQQQQLQTQQQQLETQRELLAEQKKANNRGPAAAVAV